MRMEKLLETCFNYRMCFAGSTRISWPCYNMAISVGHARTGLVLAPLDRTEKASSDKLPGAQMMGTDEQWLSGWWNLPLSSTFAESTQSILGQEKHVFRQWLRWGYKRERDIYIYISPVNHHIPYIYIYGPVSRVPTPPPPRPMGWGGYDAPVVV